MRLTVFGATGGTGRQLVDQALAAGDEITAVVRDPARLPVRHDRLTTVRADILDPAAVERALAGSDAALSSLGHRRGDATQICSAAMASITKAMEAAGVRRLVAISAAPVAGRNAGDTLPYRLLLRPVLRTLLRAAYADMEVMERTIAGSGLAWTVVRPPMLTNGPLTTHYRTAVGANVRGGRSISRADLADAMLVALADDALVGKALGVAY